MNAMIKIPPAKLPYRGEPTRTIKIYDDELARMRIEAEEKTRKKRIKPWTAEEDELVAAAYKSGKSVPEICAETGRTKDSVVHRLQKLSKTGAFEMRPRGKARRKENE